MNGTNGRVGIGTNTSQNILNVIGDINATTIVWSEGKNLSKGYDYRSISNMLKVSTGTVGRVASKIEEKGWKLFVRKLEGLEDWDKFWHDMEKLLMRSTGAGRRMFLSEEEIEGIVRKHKRLSS
ncbi:MAG: hypothetical protein UU19_C0048G0007 [Candidatus Curtissbacteria bacterium GW2011_GWD1_40_8]|nr:MAG: hypothetical protein UU19_C0048G0007 [Candidatus Curtissbacteria bacterium GW2011_GWD1_40_8]